MYLNLIEIIFRYTTGPHISMSLPKYQSKTDILIILLVIITISTSDVFSTISLFFDTSEVTHKIIGIFQIISSFLTVPAAILLLLFYLDDKLECSIK